GERWDRFHVRHGLRRLPDHEIGLEVRDPVPANEIARAVDLLVRDRLADDATETLGPRLGRDRERAMPTARERRDQRIGQAVGPDRGDRHLEPRVVDHVEELPDPRIVADARADETDARRAVGGELPDGLAQGLDAAMPDRAIDLALEAEATSASAAL